MSRLVRSLSVAVPAFALALAPLAPVGAGERPETIALETGSMPEGISSGPGTSFFAGARSDGAIYAGDIKDDTVELFVAGREDGMAVGLLYDAPTKRLWVAGGMTGEVTAYDSRTGEVLFSADAGEGRFLNDVAVTRDAIYVTDSRTNEIVVIPLGKARSLPADGTFRTLTVGGEYVQPAGFGLNGIRVLPTGDLVVVSGGVLYAVDPVTGSADVIEQNGPALSGGDGLVLQGTALYVVNGNGGNEVVALRFGPRFTSTSFDRELTDPDFDRPTTAALLGGDLYVVNGRFGTIGTTPDAPVQVVRTSTR